MQPLKSIILAAVMAAGVNSSAIPRDDNLLARQNPQCDVPPGNICQVTGAPMNCEFCCVNFNPGRWSDCHKHDDVACNGNGKIWHCESHK